LFGQVADQVSCRTKNLKSYRRIEATDVDVVAEAG
jgi:hypothetical protein